MVLGTNNNLFSAGTIAMPLADTTVRNAKPGEKPRKLSDGGGLHLLVTLTGSRLWRMQYRFEGRQKMLTFPEARPRQNRSWTSSSLFCHNASACFISSA